MRKFVVVTLAVVSLLLLTAIGRASAATNGTLDLKLNQASALADYYVDGQLVASQVATVSVSVTPNKSHKVEARNITDPTTKGIFKWKDSAQYASVGSAASKTIRFTLVKQYLKGFIELTCSIANPPASNAYCQPTVNGVAAARLPQKGKETYTLDPGSYTINVRVGPEDGSWVTLSTSTNPSSYSVTVKAGVTTKVTAKPKVYVCQYKWTFHVNPTECATDPGGSYHTVIEHFEHGMMLWDEASGIYDILTNIPGPFPGTYAIDTYADPLNPIQDTSGSVETPPPGYFAPVNGFGVLWRGDKSGTQGYRPLFGWATDMEVGYEAQKQCGSHPQYPKSTCYIMMPDGQIIFISYKGISPLWGWVSQP
jgi:hypothetical protein